MKIPISKTILSENEISSVIKTIKSGWLVQGPKVKEFERLFSKFVGVKYSIAVTSCTTALNLSLAALNIGKGDEVIVPAFTWISTANVVENLNAKVVFCDIDLNTFNIDVSKIESKITKKTKAIIPVHLFGLAANIKKVNSIAKKNKIKIIEDAACGFGTYYNGQHVGKFGITGCFSFHPRKSITTGEGGMITTNNKSLALKLRSLRDNGANINNLDRHLSSQPYLLSDHSSPGLNQRMTDIQASLGCSQMIIAKRVISERRRLFNKYNKNFKKLNWLQIPSVPKKDKHGCQSYACLLFPEIVKKAVKDKNLSKIKYINSLRNKWMQKLQKQGIGTRPATHAVHMLSYYKKKYKISEMNYPNALAANDCSISLPLFYGMTDKEQNFIIKTVKEAKLI